MSAEAWLVRSRLLGRLPLGDGRTLVSHVLGRTRVVCSPSALTLLESFELPKAVESTGLENKTIALLRTSLLLRVAGNGEVERIRSLFALELTEGSPPSELFPRLVVKTAGLGTEERPSPEQPLSLSGALATLELQDGSWLVTHPAGNPVRISAALWRAARAFETQAAPAAVRAVEEGLCADEEEWLAACRFLWRRGLLWRSQAEERQAAAQATHAAQSVSAEIEVLYPAVNRWRQTAPAYEVENIRQPCVEGRIALVGPCKVQQIAATLEHLARRAGWALDVHGVIWPEASLSTHAWLALVMPCSQFAVELYEALSEEDESRCRQTAAAALVAIEKAVVSIRRYSQAPLYAFSLGRPGLPSFTSGSAFELFANQLLAEVNGALHGKLKAHGPARLIDEDRLVFDFRSGAFWDDDVNAAPHHSPISSWNWVVMKPGVTDGPFDSEGVEAEPPVRRPHQADPSAALALAVLRELTRDHTRKVSLIIFEPNALLWPGRLEEGEGAYVQAPTFYADVEDYFYSGLHEALSIVRRRGIRLACASSCPSKLLSDRWQVKSRQRNVVRLTDLELVRGGPDPSATVREVLKATGVDEADALWVDFTRAPLKDFSGRIYLGDRWNLRRYLLTAPELT